MTFPATISRSESIAAGLRAAIESGAWGVGSKLPPTRQLATDHNASLSTVHSALRELEILGMIQRRGRSGIFVNQRHPLRASNSVSVMRHVAVVLVRWRDDFSDSWSHEAIIETQHAIAATGFHALPLFVDPYADDALAQLRQQLQEATHALAGVILINSAMLAEVPAWLDQWDVPWVYLNQPHREAMENFVGVDYLASFALGQCLARMGLERIVALGLSPTGSPTSVAKLTELIRGYIAASGRAPTLRYWSQADDPDGSARTAFLEDVLQQPGRPEVIFAGSDAGALRALRACGQLHLRVPDDVRIVGGTGVSFSAHTHPPMTVVGQTAGETARMALEMLHQMVESGTRRVLGRRVPARLTIRGSLVIPSAVIEQLPVEVRPLVKVES